MKPPKEPALVLFCPRCSEAMNVPNEIRTLAEAMAAEIVFGVANGSIDPKELRKAKPDPHLIRHHAPVPPNVDRGT